MRAMFRLATGRAASMALAGLTSVFFSCARPAAPPPATSAAPVVPASAPVARYATPSEWLCRPGRADACAGDLTATVLHADGSRTVERSEPARDSKVDCFYVYPTVDVSPEPGNHEDFADLRPMTSAVLTQAARLRQACSIYSPLYRQVTIGSYFHPDSLEPRLALAFADVEAAFREYLAKDNGGRPIVLVGHSQGADMVIRLLQRFFDHDASLRSRLVLALPIGWTVEVPRGNTKGGTFENVPVCTSPDEVGCVVAYQSYEAGPAGRPRRDRLREGNVSVCVNPATVGSDAVTSFSRAYLRVSETSRRYLHVEGVDTPFVELEGYYQGQCADGPDGVRYLAVSTLPGDSRNNPVDYARLPLHQYIGLHVLDMQIPQGDLVDLVTRHVRAFDAAPAAAAERKVSAP
jgi:hypothetical protein